MIEFLKDPFGRKAIRRLFVSLKQAERRERDLSVIADTLEGEVRDLTENSKKLSSRLRETENRLSKANAIEGDLVLQLQQAERVSSEYKTKLIEIAEGLIPFSVSNATQLINRKVANQTRRQSDAPPSDEQEYRILEAGEVIQVDDEFFYEGDWRTTKFAGETVVRVMHRKYRRLINRCGN